MLVCDRCSRPIKESQSDLQRALSNEELGEYCDQCGESIEKYLSGTHVIISRDEWKRLKGTKKK